MLILSNPTLLVVLVFSSERTFHRNILFPGCNYLLSTRAIHHTSMAWLGRGKEVSPFCTKVEWCNPCNATDEKKEQGKAAWRATRWRGETTPSGSPRMPYHGNHHHHHRPRMFSYSRDLSSRFPGFLYTHASPSDSLISFRRVCLFTHPNTARSRHSLR